jgi:ABC transporter substrate binding protein
MAARGARAAAGKAADHRVPGLGLTVDAGVPGCCLLQRLRELGWIENRTVAIEYRWAEGRSERYGEIAADFVRLKADVIVTSGAPIVLAIKQATSVIPIVFATVADLAGETGGPTNGRRDHHGEKPHAYSIDRPFH